MDHILKGKDGSEIDFMCLTMIDPAISWFKIVELPFAELTPSDDKTKEAYFDKSQLLVS